MTDDMKVELDLVAKMTARLEDAGLGESRLPSGPLYHYTTAKGLEGIFSSKVLFATHTDYLNDLSEIQYGRKLIAQVIYQRLAPIESNFKLGYDQNNPFALLDQIPADKRATWVVLYGLSQTIRNHNEMDIFVTSFCEEDDLLSQWRGYGSKGGGYSIGFEMKSNVMKVPSTTGTDGEYGLFPVLYDQTSQNKLINSILDDILVSLEQNQPDGGYDIMMTQNPVYKAHWNAANLYLRIASMRFKDEGFSQEKEWRFYATSETSDVDHIQFRESNGILVPYIKLPLHEDTVKINSITCGPSLRPHLGAKAAKMAALKYKIRPERLVISRIPFNAS